MTTSSAAGLRSTKQLPGSNLHQRKGRGHCLRVCCRADSLQPSASRQNHAVRQVCAASRRDARKTASIGQQKGPSSSPQLLSAFAQPTLQKLNDLGYAVLPHPPYSPDLLPMDNTSILSTTCCRQNVPQPAGGRKCSPRVHRILKHGFLHYRNKQTSFLSGKNVLILMVPIVTNKMCLSLVIIQ